MKIKKVINACTLGLMCASYAFMAKPLENVVAQSRPVISEDLPEPWARFKEFLLTGTEQTVKISDVCSYTKNGSNLSLTLKRSFTGSSTDANTMLVIPENLNVTIDLNDKNIWQYHQFSEEEENVGIFDVYGNLTINSSVANGELYGADCEYGGIFKIHSNATVTINAGYLWGNDARDKGGLAYVHENGTLIINGGDFDSNGAAYGGSIYLEGTNSKAIINGGQFRGSNNAIEGGIIKVCKGAYLEINGGSLVGYAAQYGGAIYNSGEVIIKGGSISYNHARSVLEGDVSKGGYGGAIYSEGTEESPASVKITGGNIAQNNATNLGGGIANSAYSSLTFSNLANVSKNYIEEDGKNTTRNNVTILDKNYTNLITAIDSGRNKIQYNVGINTENESQSDIFTNYTESTTEFFVPDSEEFAIIVEDGKFKYVKNEYCAIKLRMGPRKTEYKYGEDLDLTGIKVEYVMLGGQKTSIKVTDDMISGYDKYTAGRQKVTITYNGFTTTFDVTVGKKPNKLPAIIIISSIVACAVFIPIIVFSSKKRKKEQKTTK